MTKHLTIKPDQKTLDALQIGSMADLCALATGNDTSDGIWFDEYWTPDATLKEYDYEAKLLWSLNANEPKHLPNLSAKRFADMEKSDLQRGAWLALHEPNRFKEEVERLKGFCAEHAIDASMFDEPSGYPADLAEELVKSREWYQDFYYREWLHGDRSNDGILDLASKLLTGERGRVAIDEKDSAIIVSVDTETIDAEYLGEIDDTTRKHKMTRADLILDRLVNNAYNEQAKQKQQAAKRREDRERTQKYQAEQAAAAADERRAKLLAMKK